MNTYLAFSRSIIALIITLTLLASLTSCLYKMPDEDSFRTIPTTNNPNIIKESGNVGMPAMEY